jgi:hypothetical protein
LPPGRAAPGLASFEVDFATCLDAWVVVFFFGCSDGRGLSKLIVLNAIEGTNRTMVSS